jgi:hypothetical protein
MHLASTSKITTTKRRTRFSPIHRARSSSHSGDASLLPSLELSGPTVGKLKLKLKENPPPTKNPKNHKKRSHQVSQKASEIRAP